MLNIDYMKKYGCQCSSSHTGLVLQRHALPASSSMLEAL